MTKPSDRLTSVKIDPAQRDEARQIATELAALARTAKVLPGSIQQRHMRCGQPSCACHANPPRLHGPYWQWTRKLAGKTVTRYISADTASDYQAWIANDRRIRELLTRLEALGTAHLEAEQPHT